MNREAAATDILAMAGMFIPAVFAGDQVIGYLVGAVVTLVVCTIWFRPDEADGIDLVILERWIKQSHLSHGGTTTGKWAFANCTEQECEEGRAVLGKLG